MASHKYSKTQAIVCREPSDVQRQWVLEEVAIAPPEDDEVTVEMVATGICHTDFICGSAPHGDNALGLPPYPRVLGHEGAGYVKPVGSRVTKVRAGDRVLLSFSFCTQCYNCQNGAPGYCHSFTSINFGGSTNGFISSKPATNGEAIGGSFFGQSSFARLTRVKEASVVKVTELLTDDIDLRVLAPLGCGVQTGAGTITELATAKPSDKIAVIGLGAVGQAAIMAAKIRGCRTIIAIDRIATRLQLARSFGATHALNTSLLGDGLVKEIRDITGGAGTTITVDAKTYIRTMFTSTPLVGIILGAGQGRLIFAYRLD